MPKTVTDVIATVNQSVRHLYEDRVKSVNSERFDGETALHIVAKWGDEEAIRLLVCAGAPIDKPGEDGNTPLHHTAMPGHFGAVATLVQLGARCAESGANQWHQSYVKGKPK
jgi:uncharacterized protein